MTTSTPNPKVECLNPNTGRKMNIDKKIYDLISTAIREVLKKNKPLTFTELTDQVDEYLRQHHSSFDKSVPWYTVSIKHDMHARGLIDVFTEKGKKLHRLSK